MRDAVSISSDDPTEQSPLREVVFAIRAIMPLITALILLVVVVLREPLPTLSVYTIKPTGGGDTHSHHEAGSAQHADHAPAAIEQPGQKQGSLDGAAMVHLATAASNPVQGNKPSRFAPASSSGTGPSGQTEPAAASFMSDLEVPFGEDSAMERARARGGDSRGTDTANVEAVALDVTANASQGQEGRDAGSAAVPAVTGQGQVPQDRDRPSATAQAERPSLSSMTRALGQSMRHVLIEPVKTAEADVASGPQGDVSVVAGARGLRREESSGGGVEVEAERGSAMAAVAAARAAMAQYTGQNDVQLGVAPGTVTLVKTGSKRKVAAAGGSAGAEKDGVRVSPAIALSRSPCGVELNAACSVRDDQWSTICAHCTHSEPLCYALS